MFSLTQKREIADKVQQILKETNHPELPEGEISFHLLISGAESWSYADIRNNGAVPTPGINPYNERVANETEDKKVLLFQSGTTVELNPQEVADLFSADKIFGEGASEAREKGLCIECRQPALLNCYSTAGATNYFIHGLCERCFDKIFEEK